VGGRRMNRRGFARVLTAGIGLAPFAPRFGGAEPSAGGLTDVAGVKVGHFTETRRPTGCTVVLVEAGAACGVDVRGGAPGTRETDLLDPVNTVQQVHAVVLSGGSAFGLDTAGGVARWLEERKIGFPAGPARVPIVPAAILFDLSVGDSGIRPDAAAGYAAAKAATTGPVAEGNVGAGTGATVGKLLGFDRAMKAGLGTAAVTLPGGAVIAALAAVNAAGDVVDPSTGRIVAGARTAAGDAFEGTTQALLAGRAPAGVKGESTVLVVVATNVALTKTEATKVARMAHDGLARAVNPVHTPWDGDTVFAVSVGSATVPGGVLVVGTAAAEVTARAIVRGTRLAQGLPGLPAAADLGRR
jgi:L-aminopeptidase/D-esterase-like protein